MVASTARPANGRTQTCPRKPKPPRRPPRRQHDQVHQGGFLPRPPRTEPCRYRCNRPKNGEPVGDPTRSTTVKERICGVASGRHRQQLARIDTEAVHPLNGQLAARIVELIAEPNDADLILIADYAKGVCTDSIALACIDSPALCIVDPPRNGSWTKYRCATCLVPNREEANGSSPLDLMVEYSLQAAVVKLDQDGCRVHDDILPLTYAIHAQTRIVHDVTGAGDQFAAVLGCARAAGASWREAAELANTAAGLQVERHGCIPVTLNELCPEVTKCRL